MHAHTDGLDCKVDTSTLVSDGTPLFGLFYVFEVAILMIPCLNGCLQMQKLGFSGPGVPSRLLFLFSFLPYFSRCLRLQMGTLWVEMDRAIGLQNLTHRMM